MILIVSLIVFDDGLSTVRCLSVRTALQLLDLFLTMSAKSGMIGSCGATCSSGFNLA